MSYRITAAGKLVAQARMRQARYRERHRTDQDFIARKREYDKAWSERNPAKRRENSVRCIVKLRKELIDAYGGKCVHCGHGDARVLSIDHIDNTGSIEKRNGYKGHSLWLRLRREGWPKENYQLLCRNCNWLKHILNQESKRKNLIHPVE